MIMEITTRIIKMDSVENFKIVKKEKEIKATTLTRLIKPPEKNKDFKSSNRSSRMPKERERNKKMLKEKERKNKGQERNNKKKRKDSEKENKKKSRHRKGPERRENTWPKWIPS